MRAGPHEDDESFASEDDAFEVFRTILDRLVASGGGRGCDLKLQRYVADPAHVALEERMAAAVVDVIDRSDTFSPICGALCAYDDTHIEGTHSAGKSPAIRTAIRNKLASIDVTEEMRHIGSGNPYIYVMRLFWSRAFDQQLVAEGFPVDSHVRERVVSIDEARVLKQRFLANI